MEEENLSNNPPETDSENAQQPVKKRRGRPPRAKTETPPAESADTEKKPKRRGRPPRAKVSQPEEIPSQEPSAPNDQQPDPEPQNPETEIFVHRDEGDDFAYASRYREDSEESTPEEDDSEKVPEYFSTTDEDLDPNAYASRYNEEDALDDRSAEESPQSEARPQEEPRQERGNQIPMRRFDKQNQRNQGMQNRGQGRFQNNRQQNYGRFQNNRGQQSSRGGNLQRNNQIQQRQQNINQRNTGNQQRQQMRQKSRWNQSQNAEEDYINPADLPEWGVLKSEDFIKNYLLRNYCGVIDFQYPEDPSPKGESPLRESGAPISETTTSEAEVPENTESETKSENTSECDMPILASEGSADNPPNDVIEEKSYWQTLMGTLPQEHAEGEEKNDGEISPTPDMVSAAEASFVEDDTYKVSDAITLESLSDFNKIYALPLPEMREAMVEAGIPFRAGVGKCGLAEDYYKFARQNKKLVKVSGILDVFGNGLGGALAFECDSYKLRRSCAYIPQFFIDKYKLSRGTSLNVLAMPPREDGKENCPIAVKITSAMGLPPEAVKDLTPFTDLTPYYPTRRMIMELPWQAGKDNISMRAVDLLTPIGLGQRALIVAPPRTGKTVLMQNMAKSIRENTPEAHLMILLVDERPEEVTDFRRNVDAEVISSTFDEDALSHVHAAEMVISKARRMVECGKDVVILLDSITRLARAYNALMPNGGRTMTGGVEANALQKPKKFFGSARNIEGGGALTVIGTALIETGSKMDEVIFEEFKGTGNLELHLDRQLSDKRIFPAINIEKSGTRKEELLYHPDELVKIYALRRAMKGVPTTDAMEMLIQRLKKVKTNVEFLMGLNR